MNNQDSGKFGGFFRKTHIRDNKIIDVQDSPNIVPDEGLIYLLNAGINGGAAKTSWYVGVFLNNYVPIASDVGDTFFTVSNEMTQYSGNRPVWTTDAAVATSAPDPVGISVKTTDGSEASYTIDNTVSGGEKVYGAAIISELVKGGSSDTTATVLLAATQFTNPGRDILEKDVIKVEYFITGTST